MAPTASSELRPETLPSVPAPRVHTVARPFDLPIRLRTAPARQTVPLASPNLSSLESDLIAQVLAGDVLALGPFAKRFEAAIAALAGRREGVACSSGTAGLHMAVCALDLGEDDEVITTPFSFVASANCLLYERVVPRFVDIEEDSLGIDPDLVEDAAGRHTRGVLPVHVFGRPCRIGEVTWLARRHGWSVIEDACEGLGSTVMGRPLGGFGDVAVFGFYPNKQITTGEGGMAVTDDAEIAETMRSLRNQGRDADGIWLRHIRLGYNYRLDELSAALGVAQVERLAELRAGRDRVVRAYNRAFEGLDWLRLPAAGEFEDVDWFVYVVRLDVSIDRDRAMQRLAELGVCARPYFTPIHLQPFYRSTFGFEPGDFPVTERVAASTLALPFSSCLGEDAIRYVAAALIESVDEQFRC